MNYIDEIKAKCDYQDIVRDNKKLISEITNFLSKKMIISDQDYDYCVILIRTFEDNLKELLNLDETVSINVVHNNVATTLDEKASALRTIKYQLNYLMLESTWEYVMAGDMEAAQWEQAFNRIFRKLEVFRA